MNLVHEQEALKPGTVIPVKVQKLPHFRGELPRYQTEGASGLDLTAQISEPLSVLPGQRILVPTGLVVEVPQGFELQVRPRSGWAWKQGLTVLNTPGTIDSDYRGEIQVILINLGSEPVVIEPLTRIAQLVLCPVFRLTWVEANELSRTFRQAGGFGHTGVT